MKFHMQKKQGKRNSGSGEHIIGRSQAIAISVSQAREERDTVPNQGKSGKPGRAG